MNNLKQNIKAIMNYIKQRKVIFYIFFLLVIVYTVCILAEGATNEGVKFFSLKIVLILAGTGAISAIILLKVWKDNLIIFSYFADAIASVLSAAAALLAVFHIYIIMNVNMILFFYFLFKTYNALVRGLEEIAIKTKK